MTTDLEQAALEALTARAEAAEAELAEAHTHFAIQGGRIREAQERAQAAEATLVELQPADVLVEGSWIPVAEWPTILGNFMRSSAEYAREAKALHARIAEALALHVKGVMYADDIPEGTDYLPGTTTLIPDDYEHHYCELDGEDWPCSHVRILKGES